MSNETGRLELATRIVYSVKSLSGHLQAHWNELLHFLFHDQLSSSQIEALEVAAARRPFHSESEWVGGFTASPADEQRWVVGALKCLHAHAAELGDVEEKKALETLLGKCEETNPALRDTEMDRVYEEMRTGFQEFTRRKYFLVPGSIRLFTLDFILRWLALFMSNELNAPNFRIFANLLIPAMVLLLAVARRRRDYRHNLALIQSRNDRLLFGFRHFYTTAQYTTLALYLATGTIIASLVFNDFWAGLGSLVGLVFYYYLLMQVFPVGKLSAAYLENQLSGKSTEDYKDADENDERIVLLETQLTSNSGRLEAYVLESALFGALAFSAFLQIFATNLISFADVEKFALNVQHVAHGFILGDNTELTAFFASLNTKESLFSLISIETLVCSGLFVAVIASRLRFSHVADRMRTELNLAKAYNEKEERLLESDDPGITRSERFLKVNRRIHDQLEQATARLKDIDPIVKYIVYFRNLGVIVFAAVLITSCLFISSALAWAFLLVVVITWIYFNYARIKLWVSGTAISARLFFAKYSYALLALTLLPATLGFLLHVYFAMNHVGILITLTFVLLTVYLGTASFLSYYDPRFGEIKVNGWPTIQFFFGLAVLLVGVGLTMKTMHQTGANEVLIISDSFILVLSVIFSFCLTRPKALSFVWAFTLCCSTGSMLFKTLHWNGANELPWLASWLLPVCWLVYFIQKKWFHKLFIRVLLVNTLVVLLFTTHLAFYPLDFSLFGSASLMYEHRTLDIGPVKKYFEGIDIKMPDDVRNVTEDQIKKSIAVCEDYLNKYGTTFGPTEIYNNAIGTYGMIAEELAMDTRRKADSVSLAKAYLAIEEADKIAAMFNYDIRPDFEIKAAVLEQMGRKDEAIRYYEKVRSLANDEGLKESAQKNLNRLRKQ